MVRIMLLIRLSDDDQHDHQETHATVCCALAETRHPMRKSAAAAVRQLLRTSQHHKSAPVVAGIDITKSDLVPAKILYFPYVESVGTCKSNRTLLNNP